MTLSVVKVTVCGIEDVGWTSTEHWWNETYSETPNYWRKNPSL